MRGHITASALVLDWTHSHVLMVHHPIHNRLLPPGGHIEPGCSSLWQGAAEEAAQETGLRVMTPLGELAQGGIPLDIDTHRIAANPTKGEGAHWHHDAIFLAVAPVGFAPRPHPGDAVKGAKWVSTAEFCLLPGNRIKRLSIKLSRALIR